MELVRPHQNSGYFKGIFEQKIIGMWGILGKGRDPGYQAEKFGIQGQKLMAYRIPQTPRRWAETHVADWTKLEECARRRIKEQR